MFDGHGSERTVTNSSQTVTGSVNFEAFGQVAGSTGSSANPYMYAGDWGYRNDGDAGLMHVGARYYDAQVGRFITRDTVLSEHPYLYCEHEPVGFVDPSGHQTSALSKLIDEAFQSQITKATTGGSIVIGGGLLIGAGSTLDSMQHPPPSGSGRNLWPWGGGLIGVGGGIGLAWGGTIGMGLPGVGTGAVVIGAGMITVGVAVAGIGLIGMIYFGGRWANWW
jgi:RHS repeat-associated protein